MRHVLLGLGLLALMSTAAEAKQHFAASITRTAYGIPHIKAADWGGAGYGLGYAYAEDNLCLLAEEFVSVAGERSRFFGAKAKAVLGFQEIDNLSSDVFFRSQIDLPRLRARWAKHPAKERALLAGYAAGYNRRLRDLGAAAPAACRGKPWLRAITIDDMLRVLQKQVLLASSLALAPYIVNAAPPGKGVSAALPPLADPRERSFGSNGWAFGGEATTNGRGLVIGNPHFPWEGPVRFWEMHLTVPGEIDVMGVGLAGTPLVILGFNKDVAWTHTVTEAQHFTVFELPLVPGDPTRYLVDGKPEAMRPRTITVPTEAGPVMRTVYQSRYGAVLTIPLAGLGWTGERAFAVRDANADNDRAVATWMRIGKARSVAEVKAAVMSTLGNPWANTIAADQHGDVLHADVTAAPNVSGDKAVACATPRSGAVAARFILLDGGRSACDWDKAAGTPRPGLMPATDQAIWERRDYVVNSNDSYWLSNARAPYKRLSPILGAWGTERTLRTRSGLIETEARLAGRDGLGGAKIDNAIATQMVFANKALAADLGLKATLAACAGDAAVAAPCAALARWDGRFNADSRGAALFLAYWPRVERLPGAWGTPFSAADPVNTPRDFQGDPAKLRAALATAADRLGKQGIALDARWGEVQFAVRGEAHIPVHGGSGALGVLNVQQARPEAGGLVPFHGSSYIQVVSFDDAGPVADAVLSYSQSTDPASPHYGDQTRLYSAKQWVRLPFTPAQIAAAAIGKAVRISE